MRELVEDPEARAASDQARGDHRHVVELERARDVDPFAARELAALARAVPVAELEVRHRQRAVDGGVERDGDDQLNQPKKLWKVRPTYHPMRPAKPGAETDLRATSGRTPTSRFPARMRTSPTRSPRSTGSSTASGTTMRSTSGRPTRTERTSGRGATTLTVPFPYPAPTRA